MTGSGLGARERGTNRRGPVEQRWALGDGGLCPGKASEAWRALPGDVEDIAARKSRNYPPPPVTGLKTLSVLQ